MNRTITIFDTTLRDGEQSPGASMNTAEKLRIATHLDALGVDVIEAGFPASSPGDFEAVSRISETVKNAEVAALCRATAGDIDRAWEAIKDAVKPRIHTFIATSDIHLEYKLRMGRDEVVERAVAAVSHARQYTDNIEFSAEDGSRTDPDFLCRIFGAVIEAGATTVNLPDTVGYAVPSEFGELVRHVMANTPGMDKATLSVHCHNDLGLATANTLAAIAAGAGQAEVTINGIGERAGNTALEEVVMALHTRPGTFPMETGIDTTRIHATGRLVSSITGIMVQPNKAIVGANAFSHESGIHQDGMLKNPMTYEIMRPETVGLTTNKLVLGKLSGRFALRSRLEEMRYNLTEEELNTVFESFKVLADRKKEIMDEDLEALVTDVVLRSHEVYTLEYLHVTSGTTVYPMASVRLGINGKVKQGAFEGNGPIDAVFNTIAKIAGREPELLRFSIGALTGGTDAQGEVTVRMKEGEHVSLGRGADPDIITASAKAYINGLNRLEYFKSNPVTSCDVI